MTPQSEQQRAGQRVSGEDTGWEQNMVVWCGAAMSAVILVLKLLMDS